MKYIHFKYLSILLVLLFFVSCSIFKVQPLQKDELVIFPSPPDTARIQYLTSISNSLDIRGKQSRFVKFVIGEEKPLGIIRPGGIHTTEGMIFICDVPYKGLEIINLENRTFELFIPQGKGKLKIPISCSVDSMGYLYVVDKGRKEIVIFNTNEAYKYVNFLRDTEGFDPVGISILNNKIWVTNHASHKVHVYDVISKNLLFTFPDAENGDNSYLYSPTNICAEGDFVYVTDFGDFKIKVYDLKGNYIRSVGTYGKYPGQFSRPKGVSVDKDENLYAVDAGFENVQIFNKKGQGLMFFGGPTGRPGSMVLPKEVRVDYKNVKYFKEYADTSYVIKHLIFVTNQYGAQKINIYGAIKYNN